VLTGCSQISDPTPTHAPTNSPSTVKQDFLDYIKSVDPNAEIDKIDSSIMDEVITFGDSNIVEPTMFANYISCYVYTSDEGILLDDVFIKSNSGDDEELLIFKNDNPEKVLYKVDDSAVLYTFITTDDWFHRFYYSVPIHSLDEYLETTQNNLFYVYIEDGVIKSMYEVYLS